MKNELDSLLKRGYVILHKDKDFVTLERPKIFSILWFLIWFFLGFGIGGLFYVIYYILMPKKKITIRR